MQEFMTLVAVSIIVIAVEYSLGNAIQFPAEDLILSAMALFGTVTTLITGGRLAKNTVTSVVAGSSGQSTTTYNPGFVVTPVMSKGVSPFTVHFLMSSESESSDHPYATEVEIDWMDGSGKETVLMKAGFCEIDHSFSYKQGNSKYTGHSFYPEFTTVLNDGRRISYNVDGKCCEVEVQSK